jgi:pyruvate/2-oxoglutarate/acetoin dehydrogenase E1 component
MAKLTIAEALREAIREEMRRDERIFSVMCQAGRWPASLMPTRPRGSGRQP